MLKAGGIRHALLIVIAASWSAQAACGAACVWKVTGPGNGILYLGGSVHALRPSDYPLPNQYERALNASSHLVLEADPNASAKSSKDLLRSGTYPKGDSLKNHVDPRTYEYLSRFFTLMGVPEDKFIHYKPWFLDLMMSYPWDYVKFGVEEYLIQRARASSKPISGLENVHEHNLVYAGLSDRESEAALLLLFVSAAHQKTGEVDVLDRWRHGDVDPISRAFHSGYQDFPSLGVRMIEARNRNWIPKIEGYLRSGQTYFVVAGAAHMGGPGGVLALLRERGYKIEQL